MKDVAQKQIWHLKNDWLIDRSILLLLLLVQKLMGYNMKDHLCNIHNLHVLKFYVQTLVQFFFYIWFRNILDNWNKNV